MLFFLVLIFVLTLVSLYYIEEGFSLIEFVKKVTPKTTKTKVSKLSDKKLSSSKLEEVQDNLVDFVAFKELHQKH